jgi:hypothetical protein
MPAEIIPAYGFQQARLLKDSIEPDPDNAGVGRKLEFFTPGDFVPGRKCFSRGFIVGIIINIFWR